MMIKIIDNSFMSDNNIDNDKGIETVDNDDINTTAVACDITTNKDNGDDIH